MVMGFLLHGETVDESSFMLEKKLTNSGPFSQSTRKHSIYTSGATGDAVPCMPELARYASSTIIWSVSFELLRYEPNWVWVAVDPVSRLLLAIDVGERTRAISQCVVHQVVGVLAPGCVPVFLTDGFKEYVMALLTHFGH
jgi:hypothetical protein